MKKTILSLMILSLFQGHGQAGADHSTLEENDEKRRSSSAREPAPDLFMRGAAVLGGAVALAGAATLAYNLYHQEDEEENTSSEPSNITSDDEANDDEEMYRDFLGNNPSIDLTSFLEDESSFQKEAGIDSEEKQEIIAHSKTVDLHPIYNKNPRKYLLTRLKQHYKDFLQEGKDGRRVHIITGTALKRSAPSYTLYYSVNKWLKEEKFKCLIQKYWTPKEGIYTVLLRKKKHQY